MPLSSRTRWVTCHGISSDITPPTAPTNLTATAVGPNQVNLSWNASTDNVAVADYLILRNNNVIATITGTTYSNTGLAANTSYSYRVQARDTAGNLAAFQTREPVEVDSRQLTARLRTN